MRGVLVARMDAGGWVAYEKSPSRRMHFPWQPHTVELSGNVLGVKGRTPFEAFYRYKRMVEAWK